MVPSIRPALHALVGRVLRTPRRFGREPDLAGMTTADLVEALIPFPDWEWLAIETLLSGLHNSKEFRITGNRVQWVGSNQSTSEEEIDMETSPPAALFIGQESTAVEPRSAAGPFLLYRDQATALMVGAGRTGDYTEARVYRVQATSNAPALAKLDNGALLATDLSQWSVHPFAVDLNSLWMMTIHLRQCLPEVLYLDDPAQQKYAIKKLYLLKPAIEIEQLLTPHLTNPDPTVRCNVLHALGLPTYSVSFVPGEPLAPRAERLEPVVLQPATVRAILELARHEQDPGVASWIVCTLKAQSYDGRLRPLVDETRRVIRRDVMPRVVEEGVLSDARELLGHLSQD